MYRYKKSIRLNEVDQMYLYAMARRYKKLPKAEREKIDRVCRAAGGEYAAALKAFLTTDKSATRICMEYYISKSTLHRAVRKFYESYFGD